MTEEYRPRWATHVRGTWGEPEEGPTGAQEWRMTFLCEHCGESTRAICTTGQVRQKVAAFAIDHLHRDVFTTSPLGNKGVSEK